MVLLSAVFPTALYFYLPFLIVYSILLRKAISLNRISKVYLYLCLLVLIFFAILTKIDINNIASYTVFRKYHELPYCVHKTKLCVYKRFGTLESKLFCSYLLDRLHLPKNYTKTVVRSKSIFMFHTLNTHILFYKMCF